MKFDIQIGPSFLISHRKAEQEICEERQRYIYIYIYISNLWFQNACEFRYYRWGLLSMGLLHWYSWSSRWLESEVSFKSQTLSSAQVSSMQTKSSVSWISLKRRSMMTFSSRSTSRRIFSKAGSRVWATSMWREDLELGFDGSVQKDTIHERADGWRWQR